MTTLKDICEVLAIVLVIPLSDPGITCRLRYRRQLLAERRHLLAERRRQYEN